MRRESMRAADDAYRTMRGPGPAVQVPPAARARALGALVPPGSHAVVYAASPKADGLLAGFCLEGLRAGERVVVLTEHPRSVAARLRAQGVGPTGAKPGALRIVDAVQVGGPLADFAGRQAVEAVRSGHEGARVANLVSCARVGRALRDDALIPRRFPVPLTLLCLYGEESLKGVPPGDAWAAARHHARIVVL